MGPGHDVEDHGEENGTSSKSKVPILERYVKRNYALDQIIRDKSNDIMTRNKLKGTCLLIEFEPRIIKDDL